MDNSFIFLLVIIFCFGSIKEGLINFGTGKNDESVDTVFIDENYMKNKLGISKKELEDFLQKNPDIKSMTLNNKTYYIRKSFDDYIKNL